MHRSAKKMKITLIAFFASLAAFSSAQDSDELHDHKDKVDRKLIEQATLVVRASVTSPGEGSKYHWSDVTKIATLKAPEGIKIPDSFKVAVRSVGEPLPIGFSTLYLVHYNPDKPEYGWKLLQEFDSKKQRYRGGFTHHRPTTKAEQAHGEQRLPRPETE